MYKLVCRSLSGSNKSLTNYTSIYRKITHNAERTQKKSRSKPQSEPEFNYEENWEEIPVKVLTTVQTKSIPYVFSRKHAMKILKLLPIHSQFSMISTSTRNDFYSSPIDLGKNKNHWSKTAEVSVNYYKDGIKQCNKIKNKYKKVTSKTKCSWFPKPFKGNIEINQAFVKVMKHYAPEPKPIDLKKFEVLDPGNDVAPKNNNQIAKISLQRQDSHNKYERKKFKIVYPTNTIKCKMGFNTLRTKNKRHKSFAQEKERNPGIPTVQIKPKKKSKQQKLISVVEFAPQAIVNKDQTVFYELSEYLQKTTKKDDSSRLITVHPVLKRASYQNKMSIKKKYNLLLLKQTRPIPVKAALPSVGIEKTAENKPSITKLSKADSQLNEVKLMNDIVIPDSCIFQHPLLNIPQEKDFKKSLKYPKGIISEKNEIFDVEDICVKTKEKYYLSSEPALTRKIKVTVRTDEDSQNSKICHDSNSNKTVPYLGKNKNTSIVTDQSKLNLKESKQIKDEPYQKSNSAKSDNLSEPLMSYFNTLNDLQRKTSLDISSHNDMHKKIHRIQKLKSDKPEYTKEKNITVDSSLLKPKNKKQEKTIENNFGNKSPNTLEKEIENLKNANTIDPEQINSTNVEGMRRTNVKNKLVLENHKQVEGKKVFDENEAIAKPVKYSDQFQNILNQYKLNKIVKEKQISKDVTKIRVPQNNEKSEKNSNKTENRLDVVKKTLNLSNKIIHNGKTTERHVNDVQELIPGVEIKHVPGSNKSSTVNTSTVSQKTQENRNHSQIKHSSKRQKKLEDINPSTNVLLENVKKENKWNVIKEQMKKISLLKYIEETQNVKRGESFNAHSIAKTNLEVFPNEENEYRKDQFLLDKNINDAEENNILISSPLKKSINQKIMLTLDIKSSKRPNEINLFKGEKVQYNIKDGFLKATFSLDMYNVKPWTSPLPQRPTIRRDKAPPEEKKKKEKPKAPVILPPKQGDNEKRLIGNLKFTIITKPDQADLDKGEFCTKSIATHKGTPENRVRDDPDRKKINPLPRKANEANTTDSEDGRTTVETKYLREFKTTKKHEEDTNKVIIQPLQDNLLCDYNNVKDTSPTLLKSEFKYNINYKKSLVSNSKSNLKIESTGEELLGNYDIKITKKMTEDPQVEKQIPITESNVFDQNHFNFDNMSYNFKKLHLTYNTGLLEKLDNNSNKTSVKRKLEVLGRNFDERNHLDVEFIREKLNNEIRKEEIQDENFHKQRIYSQNSGKKILSNKTNNETSVKKNMSDRQNWKLNTFYKKQAGNFTKLTEEITDTNVSEIKQDTYFSDTETKTNKSSKDTKTSEQIKLPPSENVIKLSFVNQNNIETDKLVNLNYKSKVFKFDNTKDFFLHNYKHERDLPVTRIKKNHDWKNGTKFESIERINLKDKNDLPKKKSTERRHQKILEQPLLEDSHKHVLTTIDVDNIKQHNIPTRINQNDEQQKNILTDADYKKLSYAMLEELHRNQNAELITQSRTSKSRNITAPFNLQLKKHIRNQDFNRSSSAPVSKRSGNSSKLCSLKTNRLDDAQTDEKNIKDMFDLKLIRNIIPLNSLKNNNTQKLINFPKEIFKIKYQKANKMPFFKSKPSVQNVATKPMRNPTLEQLCTQQNVNLLNKGDNTNSGPLLTIKTTRTKIFKMEQRKHENDEKLIASSSDINYAKSMLNIKSKIKNKTDQEKIKLSTLQEILSRDEQYKHTNEFKSHINQKYGQTALKKCNRLDNEDVCIDCFPNESKKQTYNVRNKDSSIQDSNEISEKNVIQFKENIQTQSPICQKKNQKEFQKIQNNMSDKNIIVNIMLPKQINNHEKLEEQYIIKLKKFIHYAISSDEISPSLEKNGKVDNNKNIILKVIIPKQNLCLVNQTSPKSSNCNTTDNASYANFQGQTAESNKIKNDGQSLSNREHNAKSMCHKEETNNINPGDYDITKEIAHVLQDLSEELTKKFQNNYKNKLYYSYGPCTYYDMIMYLKKLRKKKEKK